MTTGRVLLFAAAVLIFAPITAAQAWQPPAPDVPPGVLPPHEIITSIRSGGFDPVGRPVRRGSRYEVAAVDPYQLDVRVIVDAQTGEILAVRHDPEIGRIPPPAVQSYAQWPFRPWREGRPVPPRAIPSAHSPELERAKTPLPRPRPDEITGSIKIVPVAPLE
ncbi:MAG: hypothetical protein WBX07_01425 [Rhodoplanes sp.]